MSATYDATRARYAALSRHRDPDDPEVVATATELRTIRLQEQIAKAVATAPPLTDEQRCRLARLLRGNGGAA